MKKNCFDLLYQYFTKNAKCSETNHYGVPIYYCSQNSCNKGYICSQCLTEDPEHFSNHVKHFITLDSRKNFFKFLEIPIDNIEESFTSNFMINSRSKLFNKDKINDVNSFYEYIKSQIVTIINNNQKNNLIRNENLLSDYYSKKKGIKNKNNEYINSTIKEFIKKDDKHKIINLMNDIKPYFEKKENKITEKDKLNNINNIIEEEIPKIIEKCLNILCQLDNNENNGENNNNNEVNFNLNNNVKDDNNKIIEKRSEEKINSINLNDEQEIKEVDINNNNNENKDMENNIKNFENNKAKTNKIINIINDINPIKNDINILNIELNNNNNNIIDNHKSFYEGSINNISSIKTESNYETEEFESKININMNMNNIEINNKKNINISPRKYENLNRHPSVNDPFFNNKELSIIDKETEKKSINKIPFNNNNYYGFKKKEKSLRNSKGINNINLNSNLKENSWIGNNPMKDSNPTIASANNIQLYSKNSNNIINDLEIKLNQIHHKEPDYNNLIGNYLKVNNGINNINNDKIIKESNQFIIDIKKNNYGVNQQRNNTKSTINISIGNYQKKNNNNYLSEPDKLNVKTKENLNRLDKIRDQIGKLLK